jgi:hypothetical protein
MQTTLYMACLPANQSTTVDSDGNSVTTCAAPQWVPQPSIIPFLDAGAGVAIGVAILTCWATAYGFKSLRRVGD